MLKISNIDWNIDMDEVMEKLDELNETETLKVLGYDETLSDRWKKASDAVRMDMAESTFRHCPGLLYDFLELPESLELSDEYDKDQDVVDYLSDKYGYCINSLSIETVITRLTPDQRERLIDYLDYENGGTFNDNVMKKLFGSEPLPEFESSAEHFEYILNRGIEVVESGEMSFEDLFEKDEETVEVPFKVLCKAVYNTTLNVPKEIINNRNRQVLLDYLRDHLGDANVDEIEWLQDLDDLDEAVQMEDIDCYEVNEQIKQEEALINAVIEAGNPAIEAFLGFEFFGDSKKELKAEMREVIAQMPDEQFAEFVGYYLCEEVVA